MTPTWRLALLLAPLLLSFGPAPQVSADDLPRVLACEFATGTFATFDGATARTRAAEPLNFTILEIDVDHASAAVSTSAAGTFGPLRIVRAVGAMHFLEVLTEGFLATTTVYDRDPATGIRPALHSRHMGLVGKPLMASYTGVCRDR
jgi:hypothetical protein